jgi:hypothetical protein
MIFTALVAAGILLLAGCSNPTSSGSSIYGKWSSGSDSYEITSTTVKYNDGGYGFDFTATIQKINTFSNTSGVILVKYTKKPKNATKDFLGIYYRGLSDTEVLLAGAYEPGPAPDFINIAETASLETAEAKFTQTAVADFVEWSVVQPQKRQ